MKRSLAPFALFLCVVVAVPVFAGNPNRCGTKALTQAEESAMELEMRGNSGTTNRGLLLSSCGLVLAAWLLHAR